MQSYFILQMEDSDFIMVDHNLWGLKFHCDRALLLHNGTIIEFDDLQEGIKTHKELLEFPADHEID